MFAPDRHTRPRRRQERLASKEKTCIHHPERGTTVGHLIESRRHIGFFHKTVSQDKSVEALPQIVHPATFVAFHKWHVSNFDREQNDTLMQNAIVFEIVQQRMRYAVSS